MNRLRPIVALTLACVMTLTSVALGTARGQAGPAGQMVLCSGKGVLVVYMDENGEPTGAPHYCPDAALSFVDAVVQAQTAASQPAMAIRLRIAGTTHLLVPGPQRVRRARAPPVQA